MWVWVWTLTVVAVVLVLLAFSSLPPLVVVSVVLLLLLLLLVFCALPPLLGFVFVSLLPFSVFPSPFVTVSSARMAVVPTATMLRPETRAVFTISAVSEGTR